MYTHISVMKEEVLKALSPKPGQIFADLTAGAGGHSQALAEALHGEGQIIACDRDPEVMESWEQRGIFSPLISTYQATFQEFVPLSQNLGLYGKFQGILADLGVSSMQIDNPNRGFQFESPQLLDLRMNPKEGVPAHELLKSLSLEELTSILRKGEVPHARFLAQRIQKAQHPLSCQELSTLVLKWSRKVFSAPSRKNPAALVFQALRIHVNEEMSQLGSLEEIWKCLKPGGIFCVITFHSLEDRWVKQWMKSLEGKLSHEDPFRGLPIRNMEISKKGKILKPFPQTPSSQELEKNPRSRSAKLRAIEKIR